MNSDFLLWVLSNPTARTWKPLCQSKNAGQVATAVLCMALQRTLNEIKTDMGERYYLHICKMTQDAKKLSLSGTKLVLSNEIYSYKPTLLLLLLYIINMTSDKFHIYFLTATNKISSESLLILLLLLQW